MRKVRIAKYHYMVTTRLGAFSLQREADLGDRAEEVWMLIDPKGDITVHETETEGMDGIAQALRQDASKHRGERDDEWENY